MEKWLDVKGYEGYYMVSNFGNVKSIDRYVNSKNGSKMFKAGRILKQSYNCRGYLCVKLCKNGINKNTRVHRIVVESFLLKENGKEIVNHKDGNQTNNNFENLEWCNHKENSQHALANGLRRYILDEKQEKKLIELYLSKKPIQQIRKIFKISATTIYHTLKKYNVKTYSYSDRKTKYNITKSDLEEKLKKYSRIEIAEQYGCSVSTIAYKIKLYKINRGD